MAFYLLFLLLLAIGVIARIDVLPERPRREPMLAALCLLIAVLIGLRFHVGGDWRSYEEKFYEISALTLSDALIAGDPAYNLLNWVVAQIGGKIWLVNLVCGAIFSAGLWRFLKDQPNPFLGLFVAWSYLIVVVAMGYSRQAVAAAIIMAAFAGFDRDRLLRFIVLLGLATLFHKSAIVVLPLALLAITTNRILGAVLVAMLGTILYYFAVANNMDHLVSTYVTQRYDSAGALIRISMNLIPASLLLWKLGDFRFPRDQDKLWRNSAIASFVALGLLVGGFPSTAVDRLGLYLIPMQIIVCARIPAFIVPKNNVAQVAAVGIMLLYATVMYVWLAFGDYSIFWQPYRLYPIFG